MSIDLSVVQGLEMVAGLPGQIADAGNTVKISRSNESASPVNWGRLVSQGTAGGCVPFGSGALQLIGVALLKKKERTAAGVSSYAQGEQVAIMEFGAVFVDSSEVAREGDQVIGVVSTGLIGSSSNGAANGSTRIALTGAYFDHALAAPGRAKIRLYGSRTLVTTS